MKKIFISAGLVAASAAGFQNVFADGLDVVSPKAWNVSGTLRGFYDDNYSISPTRQGSAGIEVSPEISFNVPFQSTDLGIRYIYGLYYYQQRQDLSVNPFDQTHQLDFWFDHSFNERWRLKVTDSFAVGQDPALLQPNQPTAVPYRVEGDNFANHANITLDTDWTRLFSTSLSYGNNAYDYQQSGAQVGAVMAPTTAPNLASIPTILSINGLNDGSWHNVTTGNNPAIPGASLAGLLNRVEQNISLDLQWHIQPETMVFIGYNFGLVNYFGNEPIAVANYIHSASPILVVTPPVLTGFGLNQPDSIVYYSNSRDSVTHYGYVGVQHQFTPSLSGTGKIGVSYTDNYNDPLNNSTTLEPYADINVVYTYIPGSYIQLGFTQDQNATDIAQVDSGGNLTQSQESSSLYFDINHRLTPKLLASVVTRYSYSTFISGGSSYGSQTQFGIGANLNYQINNHFSCEVGYNFDNLDSSIPGQAYDRNRVYLGVTANY